MLDAVSGLISTRHLRLTGAAPEGTVVWLFVDDACAGPVFAETTAEGLAAGVEVELLPAAINTFSALAISREGLRSACSEPVRLTVDSLAPPRAPTLTATPPSPAPTETFTLTGTATAGTRIRLHQFGCAGAVLDELSAEEFVATGFRRIVRDGTTVFFGVDAVDLAGEVSACSQIVRVEADLQPPRSAVLRLLSPTPSPNQRAWVRVTGDFERMLVVPAADCASALDFDTSATFCGAFGSCEPQIVTFPADATTPWSVACEDGAGNRACFNATEAWTHDSLLLPGPPELTLSFNITVSVRAPVGIDEVWVTESADCSGEVVERADVRTAISYGLRTRLSADGGVLTAYGTVFDGGVSTPCSLPLMPGWKVQNARVRTACACAPKQLV